MPLESLKGELRRNENCFFQKRSQSIPNGDSTFMPAWQFTTALSITLLLALTAPLLGLHTLDVRREVMFLI